MFIHITFFYSQLCFIQKNENRCSFIGHELSKIIYLSVASTLHTHHRFSYISKSNHSNPQSFGPSRSISRNRLPYLTSVLPTALTCYTFQNRSDSKGLRPRTAPCTCTPRSLPSHCKTEIASQSAAGLLSRRSRVCIGRVSFLLQKVSISSAEVSPCIAATLCALVVMKLPQVVSSMPYSRTFPLRGMAGDFQRIHTNFLPLIFNHKMLKINK